MKTKFKAKDKVYIVSSEGQIEEAQVVKFGGGFYTIRFLNGGGIRLRESRLFSTKEEATASLAGRTFINAVPKQKKPAQKPVINKTVETEVQPQKSDTYKQKQIIIHVDMDAFYASVEQRDDPSLLGKPLIIGALPHERGVVATCSYEARKYGVHSAMNIKEAYRLCPHGIFMHGNHEKYRRVSNQLHVIWNAYASKSEYLALDEAYLDVTETAKTFEKACEFARAIKRRTKEEVGLNCSIGVAYSKTAAKMASEEKKPDGYFEIPSPDAFVDLVIDRDVRVLYTVGKKTAEKLHQNGIRTVRDIQNNEKRVISLLGKQGEWLSRLAKGIDDSKVTPYRPEDAKSISREFTFQENVNDFEYLKDVLLLLSISVERRAKRSSLFGKGVTLKITYADMKSITRSSVIETTDNAVLIYEEALKLLEKVPHKTLRLLGVGIHNLTSDRPDRQYSLAELMSGHEEKQINDLLAPFKERYGLDFINNIDKIYSGETLYKTVEYMRKHRNGK